MKKVIHGMKCDRAQHAINLLQRGEIGASLISSDRRHVKYLVACLASSGRGICLPMHH